MPPIGRSSKSADAVRTALLDLAQRPSVTETEVKKLLSLALTKGGNLDGATRAVLARAAVDLKDRFDRSASVRLAAFLEMPSAGVRALAHQLEMDDGNINEGDSYKLHELVTRDGAVTAAERASLQAVLAVATATGGYNLRPLVPALEPTQALAFVTSAAGWGQLSAPEQLRLKAVVSGPTNTFSAVVRARLADTIANPGWQRLTPEEQAGLLKGFLKSGKVGASHLVAPPIPQGRGRYSITRQEEVPAHRFPNGESKPATLITLAIKGQSMVLAVPLAPVAAGVWIPTVDEIGQSLSALAPRVLSQIKSACISPSEHPFGYGATMAMSPQGELYLYPQPERYTEWNRHTMLATLMHESGHALTFSTWGGDPSSPAWQRWDAAAKADGTSVSNYATTNLLEDSAETFVLYLASRGTPAFEEFRAIFPERWHLLDSLMDGRI